MTGQKTKNADSKDSRATGRKATIMYLQNPVLADNERRSESDIQNRNSRYAAELAALDEKMAFLARLKFWQWRGIPSMEARELAADLCLPCEKLERAAEVFDPKLPPAERIRSVARRLYVEHGLSFPLFLNVKE
ncbi:MAG: hypothetical protein JW741_12020 [Sedimentisphaerales bacterium]|nr:hypothetical protein [Sedimentisphaerales bacterium]